MFQPRLKRFLIDLLVVPEFQLLSSALQPAAANVAALGGDNRLVLIGGQFQAVLVDYGSATLGTLLIAGLLRGLGLTSRVSEEVENRGVEGNEHGEEAYPQRIGSPQFHQVPIGWGLLLPALLIQFSQPALRITASVRKMARVVQVIRLRVASALLALVKEVLPLAASPPMPSPLGLCSRTNRISKRPLPIQIQERTVVTMSRFYARADQTG
ncbi:hypothetical protein MITS9509_03000 [Synechococcus sp. MIT S9509]|nr:hypothetical protein MITS9504_01967 [Synechococcus sp. MIT S9504]KZR89445.1 hypothetical protein MITS9509_03000 [Synechococcus sp. MIT S9509]